MPIKLESYAFFMIDMPEGSRLGMSRHSREKPFLKENEINNKSEQ